MAATLLWETSEVHNDYLQSYQPKLHIIVAQSETASSLSAQPFDVKFSHYSKCSKYPPFSFRRYSRSATFIILSKNN